MIEQTDANCGLLDVTLREFSNIYILVIGVFEVSGSLYCSHQIRYVTKKIHLRTSLLNYMKYVQLTWIHNIRNAV